MIILSPVGSYYKEGIHPVKILVENEYVRAVAGGTGTAKTQETMLQVLELKKLQTKKVMHKFCGWMVLKRNI